MASTHASHDYDGKTRDVERSGRTMASPWRRLAEALRDRVYVGGEELRPDSRVSDVAEAWSANAQHEGKSAGTLQRYRYPLRRGDGQAVPQVRSGL